MHNTIFAKGKVISKCKNDKPWKKLNRKSAPQILQKLFSTNLTWSISEYLDLHYYNAFIVDF